ncbi:MAG: ATP-binding protein [Candidatus Rifleibacteriota bacterium]
MTSNNKRSKQAKQLRRNAEKTILEKHSSSAQNLDKLTPEETKSVLHELLVHQIELEMQNEELCNIRKELEASRARYFDLFNHAPVGYVSLNEDGLILESNMTAATLFGLSVDELKNQPLSHYIIPEDQDIFYHHRQNLFNSCSTQECELRMNRKDKASEPIVFWARLESSVTTPDLTSNESPGKNGLNCRIIISDITENRVLAERLTQAQKMETIGLLAGGVAHDYNNKLAVIIGYAELALNTDITPQSASIFFEEILKAAQHSAAITRQLLTIARKQMISPIVIDMNKSIESMLKMLRQVVGEKIDLIWRPGPDLYPAKMDPVQIDQILLNLCLNAKAAIEGRGQVTVATKKVSFDESFCKKNAGYLEGKYIMIEVSDTGCGMTDKILTQVFEPFFTTREVGQGTGLGLSTIEGIVKQNKGFTKVTSKPGSGTTFKIYLPAYTGAVIDKRLEPQKKMLPGNGETVLLVENEAAMLPMMKMMLEKLGFRVLTARTVKAASHLAEKHKQTIKLLITDVIMPEINGYKIFEMVKKTNPDIKLLFMSGHPANVLIHRGIIGNNSNFLQKPFSMSEFGQKIGKLLLDSQNPENV